MTKIRIPPKQVSVRTSSVPVRSTVMTNVPVAVDLSQFARTRDGLILIINNLDMNATKIGIWMDHQHALITEFTVDPMKDTKIVNDSADSGKHKDFSKGENHMHTKEQHQRSEYYKKLANVIKGYESVVLFGPTSAKDELFNKLTSDHTLSGVKIHIKDADKMTDNQRHAFVRDYFSKNRI